MDGFWGQPRAVEWIGQMQAALAVDQARIKLGGTPKIALHAAFSGPPGVGKKTAARIYAELVSQAGRSADIEIIHLADFNTQANRNPEAARLKHDMETGRGKPVVVLGTADEVQAFFADYPSLGTLIKHRVAFDALGGDVLAKILEKMAQDDRFQLTPEAGAKIQRVLRDKRGGSAVAGDLLDRAIREHARRLAPELDRPGFDRARLTLLEEADFAGAHAAMESRALARLEKMTGLKAVKESLRRIVAMLNQNRERERRGMDTAKPALHALFTGNPGTGKTTVARIYADALGEMGYLSQGQLVTTNPAELTGNVVGETESKTLKVLNEALGGVLFVDEAHNLVTGGAASPSGGQSGTGDFGRAALKTILASMEDHRDDLVVIFAGYPDLIDNLLDADPGLRRRFTERILFEDYTHEELGSILDGMAAEKDYIMDNNTRTAALDLLNRQRAGKDFGNAGAVRNLFEAAVLRQSARLEAIRSAGNGLERADYQRLIADDFEGKAAPDPETALKGLDNFAGLARVKRDIRRFMALVNFAKARGGDPVESFEPYFLFSGPPGTGKTSVAGVMGKVFQGLGLLPDNKVVSVNALDLIAGYTGQTAGKTRETVERALGGVLFIDEIGGLAKTAGGFNRDTVNQLLSLLETFRGRLVVIVAGYDQDINAFLKLDDGLSRRFANRLTFDPLTVDEATPLFEKRLTEKKPSLALSDEARDALPGLIKALHDAPAWASGGDIRTLVSRTIAEQAAYWADHPDMDVNCIPLEVLRQAVETVIDKKRRDAGLASRLAREVGPPKQLHATATTEASVAQTAAAVDTNTDGGTGPDFALHVETATHGLGLSADNAWNQMTGGNPDAALVRAIASRTGKKPTEIAMELKRLAEAHASKPQELGWVCMHCGSTNPDCPYKDLPEPERGRHNALN